MELFGFLSRGLSPRRRAAYIEEDYKRMRNQKWYMLDRMITVRDIYRSTRTFRAGRTARIGGKLLLPGKFARSVYASTPDGPRIMAAGRSVLWKLPSQPS
jgi:hypothetical protein